MTKRRARLLRVYSSTVPQPRDVSKKAKPMTMTVENPPSHGADGAAKPRDKRHEVRDDVVSGLILRVFPSGVGTFTLESMVRGRRRYATIGSADAMTIPEARREARRLIASYIEPAKKDSGPRTPGHPMTAFAEEFLNRQAHRWKPRTMETNSRIVREDILPAFSDQTVDAITVEQVRDWFASMSDRSGIANRAMPVLSMMSAWPSFGDTAFTTPIRAGRPGATR